MEKLNRPTLVFYIFFLIFELTLTMSYGYGVYSNIFKEFSVRGIIDALLFLTISYFSYDTILILARKREPRVNIDVDED